MRLLRLLFVGGLTAAAAPAAVAQGGPPGVHLSRAEFTGDGCPAGSTAINVSADAGAFTVLANHEPLVAGLKAGEAKVKDAAGKEHRFPVGDTGVAEISRNQATVLV